MENTLYQLNKEIRAGNHTNAKMVLWYFYDYLSNITYLSRHNTLFFTVCLILIVDFQEMGEKEKTKQIENN